jgi:putative ABC transport system ATP-binding protein/macrolide transport system ATP-binding/permease protein/lipoprotein-releasing system ATP-binding protein
MMPASILAAHGLGKRYGAVGFRAVIDVTLRIGAGEFVSIIGRSGSGKSTLLAMLGALTRPSEGKVTLDGTDIWSTGEDKLAAFRARQVGFIFQFPSLLPNLSALDNVALPALLSKALDTEPAYARARGLLADVGLADRLDSFPAMLSGGEQRRVAIARALINAPQLLLADEPTSDLDEASEAEIVVLLDRLRREQGFGLLVVSHNLDIARRAGRSYEMSRGQLLAADLAPQPDLAPAPPRLRPIPTPEPVAARQQLHLGGAFWPTARLLLFGSAVAFSLVLLADSLVGHYQRLRVQERAEKLAALEALALSALRANVKSIASLGNGSYELSVELWNVKGDKPIYVMSPFVRAYVQIGRQWIEVPSRPIEESAASVLKITGRQSYRYVFEAKPTDYAQLLPHYMHVRFVNTMLISPNSAPSDQLFERTDSYYVYLKPWDADDRDIKREVKFDGAPPLWIPMPPH